MDWDAIGETNLKSLLLQRADRDGKPFYVLTSMLDSSFMLMLRDGTMSCRFTGENGGGL